MCMHPRMHVRAFKVVEAPTPIVDKTIRTVGE